MRTFTRWVACLGLVGGIGLIVASAKALCGSNELNHGCSQATLNGFYIFSGDGVDVTTDTKFASAGYEVYRGDGTMYGVNTITGNSGIFRNVRFTGTYTVNPDCSGTLTTRDVGSTTDLHYDQFIMPSGKEFSWVQTDVGIISAGNERRNQ